MWRAVKDLLRPWLSHGRILVKKAGKYRGYKPAGFGDDMEEFVKKIKTDTTLRINTIFEIGANFAQGAEFLMESFHVHPSNIYVFEAHPEIYQALIKIHKFNAYNCAVYNEEKDIPFNIVPANCKNTGTSSIYKKPFDGNETKEVIVKAIRMDNFMNNNNISRIDFLKLDVEGASYEVLEGFGNRLRDVQAMHIEAEHGEQYYIYGYRPREFNAISTLLKDNDFEMVYFRRSGFLSDSLWFKKEIYKYSGI